MILRYKSNNKVVYNIKYYCVRCPKYRRKVLEGKIANAYFVSTVGGAPIAVIKQYVENQKNV